MSLCLDSPRHPLVVGKHHYAWTVASGLPLSCLLWPHGVVECLWPFSSCISAAYGRTGPSVRPHAPFRVRTSLCVCMHPCVAVLMGDVSLCLGSRKRPSAGECVIMLGQSTASPCPSAGGGSPCGGMAVTCVIATLDAITVWRSGQWGYRFLSVCEHHYAWTVA